jgi:hypothetical protein
MLQNWITRRSLLVACSTALAVGFTVSLPQPAHAAHVTPPDVPPAIQVEPGNRAFLEGHGVGTQNYICLPCPNPSTPAAACPDDSGFAWLLFTPEATLFNDHGKQLTTHFFSPNPAEDGTIRATWQDSRDSSIVWGGRAIQAPVSPDAIAWLLLPMAGTQEGPDRWRHADEDQLHPAGEHRWRARAFGRLLSARRRRREGVPAVHGRLLLLHERRPVGSAHGPWKNRTARPVRFFHISRTKRAG